MARNKEDLHPTIKTICLGCEWHNKKGFCGGSDCEEFLNPAGK